VLLDALAIRPGQTCLSIASAGDNTLSLLSRAPGRVIAIDMNPAQLACLELRVAAYRELDHDGVLRLVGSRPGDDRRALYARCRPLLSPDARHFWDERPGDIECGVGGAGKFENYFHLFRTRVLPLVHNRARVEALFEARSPEARRTFYEKVWNNRRWRWMFQVFFSRALLGRLGRDPSFFRYVEGSVADRISQRARHAMTVLEPAENPYLQWIFFGTHRTSLPHALRRENFDAIRGGLDRLEWRRQPLGDFLRSCDPGSVDCFNLSDIFEYMPEDAYRDSLSMILDAAAAGARLAYWNMLVPRSRPDSLANRLLPLTEVARTLHARDKAFFYSALVVEEVAAR